MSLSPGSRLGAYEIITKLGEGGMGEVYKARDPRLNRVVALKLLPVNAANDTERRERFEREAQAVAALNHPGIVTIHSVEQADGHFFLTMELVEGRSLADLLLAPTGARTGRRPSVPIRMDSRRRRVPLRNRHAAQSLGSAAGTASRIDNSRSSPTTARLPMPPGRETANASPSRASRPRPTSC